MNTTFRSFRRSWRTCHRCPIGKRALKHVLYSGSESPRYLFVGEAPGKGEEVLGECFIGKSGKLLRSAIKDAGLNLESCAFTNVVACRPCDRRGGANRPPSDMEISNCAPRLDNILHLLRADMVMLVGKVASARALAPVTRMYLDKRLIFNCVHPSFVLRNGGVGTDLYRDMVENIGRMRHA